MGRPEGGVYEEGQGTPRWGSDGQVCGGGRGIRSLLLAHKERDMCLMADPQSRELPHPLPTALLSGGTPSP